MIAKYKIIAIAAMGKGRVIGRDGKLPWNIPEDMKHFSTLTRGHTVLMGRKTFDSLPDKYKPLPDRENIVISRSISEIKDFPKVKVYNSIQDFYLDLDTRKLKLKSDKIWIIGGEQIYKAMLSDFDQIYLTYINDSYKGDVFFPEFEDQFELTSREDFENFSFLNYSRK